MRIPRTTSRLLIAAALLAGIALPLGVRAQTITSPYRFIEGRHDVGVVAGYQLENRGSLDIGPGDGPYVGVRYGFHLSGPFAVEATGFYIPTDRHVYQPVTNQGLVRLGTTDMTVVGLDARIRFTLTGNRTWNGLAPYVSLGAGVVGELGGQNLEIEEGLTAAETFEFGPGFLGVIAAGTRWIPGDRLTIRLEGGIDIWKVGMPAGFRLVELEAGPLPGDEWTGVAMATLGVSYRF